jgi:hypothetical protein
LIADRVLFELFDDVLKLYPPSVSDHGRVEKIVCK